ncbi:hypothetical protein DCMF_11395 [Candidatus Formimonas warabiya]|uniref:Uncharacterized protein n=1 Tax=Formimonas warabiya TaxID=1761012 RepID=A0A3G1KS53_FORW1|nr:hypothetical protein DCMF_11395 [Candidatus Formimonas warabiya]
MKPGKTALNYSMQHNITEKTAQTCRKNKKDHDTSPWSEDKLYKIVSFECAKCFGDSDGIHIVHD